MATESTQQVQNYGIAPQGWSDCPICMDIKDDELIGHNATDQVIHKYHQSCLNEWLRNSMSCPECRAPLASRDISRIQNPLLQLELALPQMMNTPKAYIKEIAENLPLTAGLSSAFVVGEFLGRGVVPLNPFVMFLGSGIGVVTSRVIRNHLREAPVSELDNDFQKVKKIVQSKTFLGTMAVAGAIGTVGIFGAALTSTLPIVLGGMAVHYGLEKLNENDVISPEAKSSLQKATAIFTAAYGLMSPLRSLMSLGIGAATAAIADNMHAPERAMEQQEAL